MKSILFFIILSVSLATAGPIKQMDEAFSALSDLMPFLLDEEKFHSKEMEKTISQNLNKLEKAFKKAKHDDLIKHDLFAPSYALTSQHLKESVQAFKKGKKDYAYWAIKETTSLCMECHTRLPSHYTSRFRNDELKVDPKKYPYPYERGLAFLIVRMYEEAKESFDRDIQDKLITKNDKDLILPFQQLLLIELKVMKNPSRMDNILSTYIKKKIPADVRRELEGWRKRLVFWKDDKYLKDGIKNDNDLKTFIDLRLIPLEKDFFNDSYKVDQLIISGILSNYFFDNQNSPSAPEINYWMGRIEIALKKESFLSSGELFLNQCIRRYPTSPFAPKCLKEYRDSLEFDFSGSGGLNLPPEIERELKDLDRIIHKKSFK